jgi:hypothetical protein
MHQASGQEQSAEPADEPGESDEAPELHGGAIERVHEGCSFPDGAEAPAGNWTHGDYVSAWAAARNGESVADIAHSSCGKPAHAGGPGAEGSAPGRSGEAPGHSGEAPGRSG